MAFRIAFPVLVTIVISFYCTLGYSAAALKPIVVVQKNETITKRDGTKSNSLVYGCVAGNRTGPCVDSKELCTSQGGEFVGYCFFDQQYKGICCVGLDPATSTLTTTARPSTTPNLNDSPEPPSATTPSITFPTTPAMPSTPTAPTAPAFTTPSVPSPPSAPPAPTPPALPTSPEFTTPAPPTAPAFTTPSAPTLPPAPSAPTQPALPTSPEFTTPAPPTAPAFTTPSAPTLPTAPSAPTQPALPTSPEFTTPAPPTAPAFTTPSVPSPPTTPSVPTAPPLPTQPAIPTPGAAAAPSTPGLPATPALPSTPELTAPTTPSAPAFSTPSVPTIPSAPGLPTTPTQPSVPSVPSLAPPSAQDTNTADETSPAPDPSCSIISTDVQSTFSNPSYPSLDTKPNVYQYTVVPQNGYCALRLEFLEALLAGHNVDSCSTDSVVIINTGDSLSVPQCGLLQGYRYTVRTIPDQSVRVVITTQSSAYLWNLNVTQIKCSSIRPYQDYESRGCGVKNAKPPAPSGIIIPPEKESVKVVSATRLLKTKKLTLADITIGPMGPKKLLQSAALNRKTEIKIVRGNETAVNEWPWQVLLMINGRPLCGGSLINDEWVITAAHCVQFSLRFPLASVLTVDLGDHDLKTVAEAKNMVVRVSQIVPNVKYEAVHNDIALIRLATKVPLSKTIKPVCLPYPKNPVSTYEGENGISTGWGRTEDSVISPVLREANMKIISNEECRQDWSSIGEGGASLIDNGMLCAGGGDVGPCNGDSGGPLVVQEYSKWRLVGLTSFGSLRGCAISGIPTVYTRVTSFVDWIALNIAE